jgi:hypothetical protein
MAEKDCGCSQQQFVPAHPEPWKLVSISLLEAFREPIYCRLRKSVFDEYLTQSMLQELVGLLNNYIAAKTVNPDTEEYYDQFVAIQEKMDYIYKKGICL